MTPETQSEEELSIAELVKASLAEAGIEEMTNVDRLAFHVLFTAAGIEKLVEERFAKAKQSQTTTGEQK